MLEIWHSINYFLSPIVIQNFLNHFILCGVKCFDNIFLEKRRLIYKCFAYLNILKLDNMFMLAPNMCFNALLDKSTKSKIFFAGKRESNIVKILDSFSTI